MADVTLADEDRALIKKILTDYRDEGMENPRLPLNVDIDGDGIADAWALDENDEVVLVPDQKLEDTVYVSEGEDVGPVGP